MNPRVIFTNIAVAVAYVLTGTATLRFEQSVGPNLSSMLWLPSGIALVWALRERFTLLPGIALGAALTTLFEGSPWIHVLATGTANSVEIGVALALLTGAGFDRRFTSVRDVILLVVLACGLAAAAAAALSVTSLVGTGGAPPDAFGRIWLMWWLTHAMGMLLIVPTTLIVRQRAPVFTRTSIAEAAILLPAITASAWIAFMAPSTSLRAELFFLPFPLILLGAVRGDGLIAPLGGLAVTAIAIVGSLTFRGPFSQGTPNEALFLTWSFVSVTIVSTVIASAVVHERARAQEEVASGQRRLEAVLEATNEAILVGDRQGRVTDVNSAFLRLAGTDTSTDEHLGRDVRELLTRIGPSEVVDGRPSPPVLDPHVGPLERSAAELRLSDGRIVEAESIPLRGGHDVPGRVWSMRDITQRVSAEEERRRLHEQILHSQKLEGLGVLAGGVAHDFNNILAGITGYAELLLLQPELDASGRSDAEGIIKASQHAAGLCGQLLTYAGKTTAVLSPVDIVDCLSDMRHLLGLSVSKGADLRFDLAEDPMVALVDEVQIRQVVFNLVTNAAEAVSEGSGSGSVLVRVTRRQLGRKWFEKAFGAEGLPEGAYVVIEVEDDGVGMDREEVAKIFDPFVSTKGSGRGLGLAAVMGVLRSHSGAIRVETSAGLGTRFEVALPYDGAQVGPFPSMEPSRPAVFGPGTILVVDDEPVIRETLARMVEKDGHTVLQAADGDEALEILATCHADLDLIVLDLTMPRRDGVSTLSEMRRLGYRIPVLLASGYSDAAVPPDAAVAGFIQKPFRSAELRERIAAVLRNESATPI